MKKYCRLSNFGFFELIISSCKHNIGYLEAKDLISLIEKFLCQRVLLIKIFTHTNKLRSLSWEYKCFHLLSIV